MAAGLYSTSSAILRSETRSKPSLTKRSRAASRMPRRTASRPRSCRSLIPIQFALAATVEKLLSYVELLNTVRAANVVGREGRRVGSVVVQTIDTQRFVTALGELVGEQASDGSAPSVIQALRTPRDRTLPREPPGRRSAPAGQSG